MLEQHDVFIAFAGGAAGIVALTRKDKFSNVIPGVAIATALMPPLCTVGYGIANGEPKFIFGAFYLFVINSVYIAIATYIVVKALKFKKHIELDEKSQKRVNTILYLVASIILVPSLYLGWTMIRDSVIDYKIKNILQYELELNNSSLLNYSVTNFNDTVSVEISIIGNVLDFKGKEYVSDRLKKDLDKPVKMRVIQGVSDLAVDKKISAFQKEFRADLVKNTLSNYRQQIFKKDSIIHYLTIQNNELSKKLFPVKGFSEELQILFPKIYGVSYGSVVKFKQEVVDTLPILIIKYKGKPTEADKNKIEKFSKKRLNIEKLETIYL